ncbi:hypothetical protein [Rhodoblastus sp.]|uniref:hypothetical protein n=1 Tax=Rhodoblastus sp. TaxID=1962975 RepID=UPI003F994DD1
MAKRFTVTFNDSLRRMRDDADSRPVLRASKSAFDIVNDPDIVHLRWLGGRDGKQIIASLPKPRWDMTETENEFVFSLGGKIDRDDLNFTGMARSEGDDIRIYRAGQSEKAVEDPERESAIGGLAVEHVGDRSAGRMDPRKMQATIEETRRVWGQAK